MSTISPVQWRPPASYFQADLYRSTDDHHSNYNVPFACTIDGPIGSDQIHDAVFDLAQRHPILRVGLARSVNAITQIVHAEPTLDLWHVDVSSFPDPDAELQRVLLTDAGRPFDLTRPPLWRAAVVRLGNARHAAAFVMHHAVCDGASSVILMRDLAQILEAMATGQEPKLAHLKRDFGDFSTWQTARTNADREAKWLEAMEPPPTRLALPHDNDWSPGDPFDLAAVPVPSLSAELTAQFRAKLRECGGRPATAVYAVAALSLAPYITGDFLVGAATANRQADTTGVVGPVFDYVPLRIRTSTDPTFTDLLRTIADEIADTRTRALPLGRLHILLSPKLGPDRPLYDVCVNFMPSANPWEALLPSGLHIKACTLPLNWLRTPVEREFYGSGRLGWVIRDTGDSIGGMLYSNAAAIPGQSAALIARAFRAVADLVVEDPDISLSVVRDILTPKLPPAGL